MELFIYLFIYIIIYSVVNQFISKLDHRHEKTKKSTSASTVKRERVPGLPSTSSPPLSLPSWMIDPSYKATHDVSSITTVCIRESSLDPTNDPAGERKSFTNSSSYLGLYNTIDDMTTYTTLISDVQAVQDDSSDFELPESVVV